MYDFGVLGDEAEQLGGPGALAVVERGADVEEGLALSEVVLAGVEDGRVCGLEGRVGVLGGGVGGGEGPSNGWDAKLQFAKGKVLV